MANTDKHIDAVSDLVKRVRNEILKSFPFSQRVMRVEVHLNDQNADGAATNSGFRGQQVVWRRHSGEPASC